MVPSSFRTKPSGHLVNAEPLEEIEAEYLALAEAENYFRAERSLSHFIRSAWPILEPKNPFVHNWHIDCVSEYLEAVQLGQIRRLIINEPPRNLKSIQVTVAFPPWSWIRTPERRFMSASYAEDLSIKHNVDRRAVIESAWFQRGWGSRFQMARDQNQKSEFMNDHRGHMIATSVGGSATGKGADVIVVDDPLNPKMAKSDMLRESSNAWFDQTITTRLDNKKTGAIILVMQRLHEKDLTGHLLAKGGWEHLCLPAEAPKKTVIYFPISKRERVREEGEILNPGREGPAELAAMKRDLGSAGYQGQYQQDPTPAAGGFFKRDWWKRYRELPKQIHRRVMFIDCAEEPGISNDFTVIATWFSAPAGHYAKSVWREKVAFPQLVSAVLDIAALEKPDAIVIENKSAGRQLIQYLRQKTTLPVLKFEPGQRSKVVRAAAAQPTVEAGNCYLPENSDWVELFISEHERFPNSEHDDQVDTTSMMAEHFRVAAPEPGIRIL